MQILASVFLGLIPEAIYFTLFLTYAKELKTRRALLFCMTLAASLISSAFLSYTVWYHVGMLAAIFLSMKILYKPQIIDVFLIMLSFALLTVLGAVCYFLIPNYAVALVVNRVLMFGCVFALRNKIRWIYEKYRSLWNRIPNAKIKSITIRNISVIMLNVLLFVFVVGMAFFQNKSGGDGMVWSFFGFCDSEDGE